MRKGKMVSRPYICDRSDYELKQKRFSFVPKVRAERTYTSSMCPEIHADGLPIQAQEHVRLEHGIEDGPSNGFGIQQFELYFFGVCSGRM